jgi:hypothetical protein
LWFAVPYTIEMLLRKVEEPCVKEWLEQLNPNTVNYGYYFLQFYNWFRQNGIWPTAADMLTQWGNVRKSEDEEKVKVIPKTIHRYLFSRRTKKGKVPGISDRRNCWSAIADFFDYHEKALPPLNKKDRHKLFATSESDSDLALEQGQLSLEEVDRLIARIPLPYDVALTVMFQGFMGLAEFNQFNWRAWRNIAPEEFEKPGLLRVNMYRTKTSRDGKVSKYYTFLSADAKKAIHNWLKVRPETKYPHLLLTISKGKKGAQGRGWVPITPRLIGQEITRTAKRIGLIKEPPKEELSSATRYHVHGHEFRDLAKSLSTLHGVTDIASEFFLGHSISSYEKSPKYDEGFFRREYRKVEPYLNIVSNPSGLRSSLDEARKAAREEFTRMRLSRVFTLQEIEAMNVSEMSVEEVDRRIAERTRATATDGGQPARTVGRQKVIQLKDLARWVDDGWELVQALPTIGQAVVRSTA